MRQYKEEHFRLRPSVSMTPLLQEGRFQFFISDIRQSFSIDFTNKIYIKILTSLDGSLSYNQIIQKYNLDIHQIYGLEKLFELLIERCVIENIDVVNARLLDPFRRVKNFISSYVPYNNVEDIWLHLVESTIVVIGVGGVGSWLVSLLAQFGIKNFILFDDDIVKYHNLNRSVFRTDDIGLSKTQALINMLEKKKNFYYKVTSIAKKLSDPHQLIELLSQKSTTKTVIINCADFPSVAQTSAIINEAAFSCNVPYIIAGGYNMHLSLIGPTVIPYKTPCFQCIAYQMDQVKLDVISEAKRIVKEHRNIGNIAPLAAISASFSANECLKLLIGEKYIRPTMIGKRGEFNFLTKKLTFESYNKWDKCPFCSSQKSI